MRIRFAIGCILLATLVWVGCAKKPTRPVAPQGRRTPRAEALEREISRLIEATRHVQAYARLELVTPDGTTQSQAALVVLRPASARIEFLDDVADVWAEAASDGKRLWLYLPLDHKLYSGRASRRNLRRLTDFEWEVPDLVSVLAGTPPIGDRPFLLEMGRETEGLFFVLGRDLRLWTDGPRDRIARCIRLGKGGAGIDYVVTYSRYRRVGDIYFPHRIEARAPRTGARIYIDVDVILGKEVEKSVFAPPKPKGVRALRFKSRP